MSNKVDVQDMKSKKKNDLRPNLRFYDFRDAQAWEEKKLIDIVSKKVKWSFSGGPFGSDLKTSDYTESGVRIIQLQNIGDAEFISDYKVFTSEQKANELLSSNIYPGEIILSKMGNPVARACIVPNDHQRYIMCSDGIRLVVDEKKYDKYFIFSFINSPQFRRRAENVSTGSTRKRIRLDNLKKQLIFIPKLAEQQKVADCLSSLDKLVASQNQKLDILIDHKKGLLQQLFPGKGETRPKLRFPDFQDSPNWEEKPLCAFSDIVRGGSPRPINDFITTDVEGLNWLKIGDVSPNSKYITHTKQRVVKAALSKTREVHPGDLILSNSMSFGRPYILKIDSCIHDGWIAISNLSNNISADFLYYFISSDICQSYFSKTAAGGVVQNLNADIIKQLPTFIPTEPEQQRIADFLSLLDDFITLQSNKIDRLYAHKKGMVQQLFPTVDKVQK